MTPSPKHQTINKQKSKHTISRQNSLASDQKEKILKKFNIEKQKSRYFNNSNEHDSLLKRYFGNGHKKTKKQRSVKNRTKRRSFFGLF
jgi:hypothetical protein